MGTPKLSISSFPTEKNQTLVNEVKKYSALYDTSDNNYYILSERQRAWEKVSTTINESATACHQRWKSLRKRYAKEKRRFPEIIEGQRRPWALFPKMSFLTPEIMMRKGKSKVRRKPLLAQMSSGRTENSNLHASDDDMLILNDNDEIVKTCKSVEMSDDEYIYETLDDPDSALEIMKDGSIPKVKATAIRSGGPMVNGPQRIPKLDNGPSKTNLVPRVSSPVIRSAVSGRIRKLTPRMQNSMFAKKLKQAQQISQKSKTNNSNRNNLITKCNSPDKTSDIENKTAKGQASEKTVLYEDKTTRHIATVNPNIIRVERIGQNCGGSSTEINSAEYGNKSYDSSHSDEKQQFKMLKLKGKNSIILSPDQYAGMQSYLKSEGSSSPTKASSDTSPIIKVRSIDNLKNQNSSLLKNNCRNFDIIHSVGLMRKGETIITEKPINQDNNTVTFPWNMPCTKNPGKHITTEKTIADSQTNGYEIEEAWNEIKEEIIDDDHTLWPQSMMEPEILMNVQDHNLIPDSVQDHTLTPDSEMLMKTNTNRLIEAKLALISHQRRLLDEQNKKVLEYMKKEHDMKMRLLEAEIELKRKQLNIML